MLVSGSEDQVLTLEIATEDSLLFPEDNNTRKRSYSPTEEDFEASSRSITGAIVKLSDTLMRLISVINLAGRTQSTPKRRRSEDSCNYRDLINAIEESDKRMEQSISRLTDALLLIATNHAQQ